MQHSGEKSSPNIYNSVKQLGATRVDYEMNVIHVLSWCSHIGFYLFAEFDDLYLKNKLFCEGLVNG